MSVLFRALPLSVRLFCQAALKAHFPVLRVCRKIRVRGYFLFCSGRIWLFSYTAFEILEFSLCGSLTQAFVSLPSSIPTTALCDLPILDSVGTGSHQEKTHPK